MGSEGNERQRQQQGIASGAQLQSYRSIWQTEIALRLNELNNRRDAVPDSPPSPRPAPAIDETLVADTATSELSIHVAETPRSVDGISAALRSSRLSAIARGENVARDVIDGYENFGFWKRLHVWWTGAAVTKAWDSVHEAECQLLDIERDADLRSFLPRLLDRVHDAMPAGDQRKRYEDHLGEYIDGRRPADRTMVRQAHLAAEFAADHKYAAVREYRNQIIIATVVLGLLLSVAAFWHMVNSNFIELCATHRAGRLCIAGGGPKATDIVEVILIGAIGGALSIAFTLGRTTKAPPRSDPRRAQRFLKVVAGGATGLLGVILIQAEILIAPPTEPGSLALLGYAALFGFSQQLFTQFVDKRGKSLVGEQDQADETSTTKS